MFSQRLSVLRISACFGGISGFALLSNNFNSARTIGDVKEMNSVSCDSMKGWETKMNTNTFLNTSLSFPNQVYNICRQFTKSPLALCEEIHQILLPTDIDVVKVQVLNRLRKYASQESESELKFKKESNGVKIFSILEGKIPDPDKNTGLNTARVGKAVIEAPVSEVANAWWNFNSRREWDSLNTAVSQIVDIYGDTLRLVYIKGKPKPMISARDFGFLSVYLKPEALGFSSDTSIFLQVDASDIVPKDKGSVRGKINSLLVLEPLGHNKTSCTYICEVEPQGWLPHVAVELAADDLPGTLGVLKRHLETN